VSDVPSGEDSAVALLTVDEFWNEGWHGPTTFGTRDDLFLVLDPKPGTIGPGRHVCAHGTVFPGFSDHHVHLGLIDQTQLAGSAITDVDDLGWVPETTQLWSRDYQDDRLPKATTCGGFITAVDGYPAHSGWAPRAAAVEVSTTDEARRAVRRQDGLDAERIKVTLNSVAGPVLDDEVLAAVVVAAHELRLPVVAHAEGAGQAERAWRAGIGFLAHTPFSERLDDELVRAMAQRMTWISTFDIHGWGAPTSEYHVAIDNARRFVAAGGRMLYGTDLGNGPLPLGVNARELDALASTGIDRDALVSSIGTFDDGVGRAECEITEGEFVDVIGPRFVYIPGTVPETAVETAQWLASARKIDVRTLTERSFA